MRIKQPQTIHQTYIWYSSKFTNDYYMLNYIDLRHSDLHMERIANLNLCWLMWWRCSWQSTFNQNPRTPALLDSNPAAPDNLKNIHNSSNFTISRRTSQTLWCVGGDYCKSLFSNAQGSPLWTSSSKILTLYLYLEGQSNFRKKIYIYCKILLVKSMERTVACEDLHHSLAECFSHTPPNCMWRIK